MTDGQVFAADSDDQSDSEEDVEDDGPPLVDAETALAILEADGRPTPMEHCASVAASFAGNIQLQGGQGAGGAPTCQVYVNYMCPGADQAAAFRTAALGILSRLSGWTSPQDDADCNRLVITRQGLCRSKIIAALSNAVDNFRVAVPEQATAQPWIVEAAAKSKPGPSATPAARQEQRVRMNAAQQGFMIPATNFQRLCKDINQEFVDDDKEVIYATLRFNTETLICLQLAAESFLQELFSVANLLALHARRVTIFTRDLHLAGMSSAARAHEADRALSTSSSPSSRPASYKPIVRNKKTGAAVSSDQSTNPEHTASGPSTPSKKCVRKDGSGEGSSENLALSEKQPRKRKESSEETENPATSSKSSRAKHPCK